MNKNYIGYGFMIFCLILAVAGNIKDNNTLNEYKELNVQNTQDIKDLQSTIRELNHTNHMLKMNITFNNIDCNLDSIKDNLEFIDMKLNLTNQIKNLTAQLNETNISLTECRAEPCTVIKHTTSYKSKYNNCKDDLEDVEAQLDECQTTDSNSTECPVCETCEVCEECETCDTDCDNYIDGLEDISGIVRPNSNCDRNSILNILDDLGIY